jgi:hypothetical protein
VWRSILCSDTVWGCHRGRLMMYSGICTHDGRELYKIYCRYDSFYIFPQPCHSPWSTIIMNMSLHYCFCQSVPRS